MTTFRWHDLDVRPVEEGKIDPKPRSGGQERLEMIVNCYVS